MGMRPFTVGDVYAELTKRTFLIGCAMIKRRDIHDLHQLCKGDMSR